VDAHRIAEARSLAYHRAIADRIVADPEILERARARVESWPGKRPVPCYARAWAKALAQPIPDIITLLTQESEEARELRQSTPFAGALDARERWRLWREAGVRARMQP
jgi:hypothetical protein